MDLPPYIAFTIEDSPGNPPVRTITCLSHTVTQADMPAGMNVVVFGDDITLDTQLTLPGQNLTVIARKVTFNHSTIDLSGAAGVPTGQAKADNGLPGVSAQQPDATDGKQGSQGNAGLAGGNLVVATGTVSGWVSVTTKGGKGSKGQDGGDGGAGLDGATGANYQTEEVSGPPNSDFRLVHQGQPGVHGGREGAGGVGGDGGAGGNAGDAVIVAMAGLGSLTSTVFCLGGDGGDLGKAGANGARAGQGGGGGSIGVFFSAGGKGGSISGYEDSGNFAASGAPGAVPGPSADGHTGKSGNAGAAATGTRPDFFSKYPPSIEQQMLTLRQAEFHYLSGTEADLKSTSELLLWLAFITTPSQGVTVPAGDARAQMNARAKALLAQLAGKLDFYGQATNHVPLASLDYYTTTLPGELAAGGVTETNYNDYVKLAGQQAAQVDKLQTLLAQSTAQLTALQASRQPLVDQIGQYQTAVSSLLLSRNLQGVAFAKAEEKWENQIIAKLRDAANGAQCKDYTDIANIFGNIVTADSDSFEKLFNSKDLGSTIFGTLQTIGSDQANWDNAVKQVETAEGDVVSIVGAASTLAADAMAGDAGKIVVDRAVFEAMLVPYKAFDATGELEAQLDLYLARAEAFSQKQLDYNALQVQLLNLDANIAQKQAEHDSIQNQLSGAANPELAVYKAFAARTYGETLDRMIRDVYGLYQAYRYWALADYTLLPSDGNWTMAYLSTIESDLNGKVTDIINNFKGGPDTTTQKFDYRLADGAGWVIDDPDLIKAFKGTGKLDFTIPIDNDPWVDKNFAGFAQVVATDFTALIHGATVPSNQLFVRLEHSGQAPFRDPSGKYWFFSHIPVSTPYKYDIPSGEGVAGGSLSGADHIQIGLSPFTTWTLVVNKKDNPGLLLTHVDRIVIKFAGRFLETNLGKAHRTVAASAAYAAR